jgi:hypothetical protein
MMSSMPQRTPNPKPLCLGIALALLAGGCGGPAYEVANVSGVLTLNGEPGHDVIVQFIPDPLPGLNLPSSVAETDDDGKFTLQLVLRDSDPKPGAVVGTHRVVLTDEQLAASETGRGVAVRFDEKYAAVGSTPLVHEVVPGDQTIELTAP